MPASEEQIIDGIGVHDFAPAPWTADAACSGAEPSVFFVDHGRSGEEAKAICHGCPVRSECLDYALENRERFGIWGGMTEKQRRAEARRRREAA